MAYGAEIKNSLGNTVIELSSSQVQIYKTLSIIPGYLPHGGSSQLGDAGNFLNDVNYSGTVPIVLPISMAREEAFVFVATMGSTTTWNSGAWDIERVAFAFGELKMRGAYPNQTTYTPLEFTITGSGTDGVGAYTEIIRQPPRWGQHTQSYKVPYSIPDFMCGRSDGGRETANRRSTSTTTSGLPFNVPRTLAPLPENFDFIGGAIGSSVVESCVDSSTPGRVKLYWNNAPTISGSLLSFDQTWNCFYLVCGQQDGPNQYRPFQVKVGVKNDLEDTAESGAYGFAVRTGDVYNFNSNRANFIGQKIIESGSNGLPPTSSFNHFWDDTAQTNASAVIIPEGQDDPNWSLDDVWFLATPLASPSYCLYDGTHGMTPGTGGLAVAQSNHEKWITFLPYLTLANGANTNYYETTKLAYRVFNATNDIAVSYSGISAIMSSGMASVHLQSNNNSLSDKLYKNNRVLIQGKIT